ncbi:MAG: chemotaxis-specific protein-glutamate methyltransferase CheB [Luteibaculaceae bacterium]
MAINALVVDDSAFMRLIISDMLNADPEITVVATANNGKDALEKTLFYSPDVVILDMTMDEYDGVYAVKEIMSQKPTPIIILSALGNTNPEKVFEAIKLGAYDFLNKPAKAVNAKIRNLDSELVRKIKLATQVNTEKLVRNSEKKKVNHEHTFDSNLPYQLLVIGASTGGSSAVEKVLNTLPSNFPLPIIIVQHMPPNFTESFAKRLNVNLPFNVRVAKCFEPVEPNNVYIMPGTDNVELVKEAGTVKFNFTNKKFAAFNHPSIDCMFLSVAEIYEQKAIGVILTGMGKDGADGLLALKKKQALTLAQDEETSVVFGMPKACAENGSTETLLPITEIGPYITSIF